MYKLSNTYNKIVRELKNTLWEQVYEIIELILIARPSAQPLFDPKRQGTFSPAKHHNDGEGRPIHESDRLRQVWAQSLGILDVPRPKYESQLFSSGLCLLPGMRLSGALRYPEKYIL